MRPTDPRVLRRLRPAAGSLSVLLVAQVVVGLLVLVQAFALADLVVHVTRGTAVLGAAVVVAAVLVARGLLSLVADASAARAAGEVSTALRRDLTGRALSREASHRATGETALLVTRGVAAAEPYLTRYVPALVTAAVLPVLTLLALVRVDLLSAAVVLCTLPLVPVFGALVGMATRDRARRQWRSMAALSGHFVDVVKGLPTLVAHRRAKVQSSVIRSVTGDYRRATVATLRVAFASSAVLELVATLSVALVAVLVGVRLAAGDLDLRTGLVVLLLAPEAYWPLRNVGAEFHAASEGMATFEEVASVLDDAPGEPEPAASYRGARGAGVGAQAREPGLVVDALTLGYGDRPAVLEGFSATVPARGLTVVVGASGCGKTTLLRALAGLHAPRAGAVREDGVPVDGAAWQARVAWLPQRPVVLSGSVADNLRLARPDATEPQMWAALGRVALAERVASLSAGLDAEVGQDGRLLSAGERARLALARVVLSDRPWVMLDEPTAHLDEVTESVVLDVVVDLARTRGVLVVSHRDAWVERADHVITVTSRREEESDRVATVAGRRTPVRRGAPPAHEGPRHDAAEAPERDHARGRLMVAAALGALASAAGVALTATAGWLIVTAAQHPPVLTLMVAIVGVRTFGLARPVLRYAERVLSHDAVLQALAERRVRVYDLLVPLTPARLGPRRGELLDSVVDDVDALLDEELRVRQPWIAAGVVGVGAAVVAGVAVLGAGLAVLALTGVAVVVFAVGRRLSSGLVARRARVRGDLSGVVLEAVQARDELVMWQAAPRVVDRVSGASRGLARAGERQALVTAGGRALVMAAAGGTAAVCALLAAAAAGTGDVSPALAAMLVLLPVALVDVVLPAATAGALAATTAAAKARLDALAALRPAVVEPAVPVPLATCAGDVALDGVSGGWSSSPAFRGVDVRLARGECLGVVGPSGSGKSTLVAALLRFVDPLEGAVALDGRPLDAVSLDDVRRHVGLVDDDPHVFASTLVENVRLARPGATDAEVLEALRRADLGDWVAGLPDGIDTWLGDGSAEVSGGERARIGLARAILADPAVLVLDEPTAHLDHATARRVVDTLLDTDPRDRTIVWVTHTDDGLDRMDAVLDLGRHQAAAPPPVGVLSG